MWVGAQRISFLETEFFIRSTTRRPDPMAMTKRVFSINGLATETGRDRRTIAAALARVPPDGEVKGGHPGWFLSTALSALDGKRNKTTVLDHWVAKVVD